MKRVLIVVMLTAAAVGLLGGCLWESNGPATPTRVAQNNTPERGAGTVHINGVAALYGISAAGSGDMWAVGETDDKPPKGAVARGDGAHWKKVAGLEVGPGKLTLRSVDAKSTSNVWVVGENYDETLQFSRVVMGHWDGKEWKTWTGPTVETDSNDLSGVAEVGPDDVWAVGHTGSYMLLMHWNGKEWQQVNGPDESNPDKYKLKTVAAVSKDDVWAKGEKGTAQWDGKEMVRDEGLLHWNGKTWREVTANDSLQVPSGVAVLTEKNLWIMGQNSAKVEQGDYQLFHRERGSWVSVVQGQTRKEPGCPLDCNPGYITALSAKNIWMVGSGRDRQIGSHSAQTTEYPSITHWNGSEWSADQCPRLWFPTNSDGNGETIYGVAAASAEEVWAVTGEDGHVVDLAHHAPCPTPLPTATPIPTDTPLYFSPTPYGYMPRTPVPTAVRPIVPPALETTLPKPVPSARVH